MRDLRRRARDVEAAPRRAIVTSSAASIWRRFASSGPHRLASARLSTGASVSVPVDAPCRRTPPICGRRRRRAREPARAACGGVKPPDGRAALFALRPASSPFPRCAPSLPPTCAASAPRGSSARSVVASTRSSARASAGIESRRAHERVGDARAYSRCRLRRKSVMSLPRPELAPDGAVQRRIELGQLQRAARVVDLRRVVQQALRDRRTHQRVEHAALQPEHLLVDRQVERRRRAAELLRVVDVERRDRHLAQERRREIEAVGRQHLAWRAGRALRAASAASIGVSGWRPLPT